jgi:carboxymethylenebutenolidase
MNKEYIYESNKNRELKGGEAIIVLPDIYGQTEYGKGTVEQSAEVFQKRVFLIDYFYPLTKTVTSFSQDEGEKAKELMGKLNGEEFIKFLEKVMEEITESYPEIKKFIVIGFCFGGRLAYIAGGDERVSRIFSFYGAGPYTPNYVFDKTPIEYLTSKRSGSNLCTDSFFGIYDESISDSDRHKIREDVTKAGLVYEAHKYHAGHAYFQEGRKMYDKDASEASWEVLKKRLNG